MKAMLNKLSKRVKIILTGLLLIGFIMLGFNWKRLTFYEEMIPVKDGALCVRDYGRGNPTVIIEPGVNCVKELYKYIHLVTSFKNRTIVYDHAGIGESKPTSNPRTLPYFVEELREMLKKKNVEPPYILIGHSMGGHTIRYFAHLYPNEVAGLVFIDQPHEDWFLYIRENWTEDEVNKYFKFWNRRPELDKNQLNPSELELLEYEANCDSLRGIELPPDMPVLMFTGRNSPHFRKDPKLAEIDMQNWVEMQKENIKNQTDVKHIIDGGATHNYHKDNPVEVMLEIRRFISKINKK